MTVFNEHNLMALNSAQRGNEYSQLLATIKLKGLYKTNQLDDANWSELQPYISDRKWVHALKLGLLTEEEFEYGGRDMDDEIKPNHVIHNPAEVDEEEESTNIEEANKLRKYISSVLVNKTEEVNADGDVAVEADHIEETDSGVTEEAQRESNLKEDTQSDIPIEKEAKIIELTSSESDEEVDEEDDCSPFVNWLKSLPVVAGYETLSAGKKEKKEKSEKKKKSSGKKKDKKKGDKKKLKEKKKQDKDKDKKSTKKKGRKKKKSGKKKKKSKGHESEPGFQDRLVNSILLNDSIASEPLAQLLHEHGHAELAAEMYKRLQVKYPEKSSYFAALIQQLKEDV